MNTRLNMIEKLSRAHAAAAERENASSQMASAFAQLGKDLPTTIAACLLTMGETHAPIQKAHILLETTQSMKDNEVVAELQRFDKIPGWGNSFAKDIPDPIFDEVLSTLRAEAYEIWLHLERMTDLVQNVTRRKLFPNAASITAAVAMHMRIEPRLSPWLAIEPRLHVWIVNFLTG